MCVWGAKARKALFSGEQQRGRTREHVRSLGVLMVASVPCKGLSATLKDFAFLFRLFYNCFCARFKERCRIRHRGGSDLKILNIICCLAVRWT